MQTAAGMNMTFESLVELYPKDVRPRLKETTWLTKENIIQKKILPYFGMRIISEITTKDVITWQNELRSNPASKAGNKGTEERKEKLPIRWPWAGRMNSIRPMAEEIASAEIIFA